MSDSEKSVRACQAASWFGAVQIGLESGRDLPALPCRRRTVKPRVLWRLVYLVPVVAGCDCSRLFWLMSGTQAAAWSTGVRIPMAE